MGFALANIGAVLLIVLVLVLIARAYPGSGADLVDWKPTRDYETEFETEADDISQMIAAQNAYRRRRGAKELTELDAERIAREDQRVRERGGMDETSREARRGCAGTEAGGGPEQESPRARTGGAGSDRRLRLSLTASSARRLRPTAGRCGGRAGATGSPRSSRSASRRSRPIPTGSGRSPT